jgi:hypothetical protein
MVELAYNEDDPGSMDLGGSGNALDTGLIKKESWVRRRRDGTSPQFGSARSKARARQQRSAFRHWL